MLKAGIIGMGAISKIHKEAILASGLGEICAVCDCTVENLKDENCPGYTDYKEMLSRQELDVVHICTPHYLHVPMALEAIAHGCNVFLEKPIGLYYEEAAQLLNQPVCVSMQNRYNESTIKMKQIIAAGILGDLIGIRALLAWNRGGAYYSESSWRGKLRKEGGALLMNQAVHTLDLLNYFADSTIKKVYGHVDTFKNFDCTEEEDTCAARIIYQNGVEASFFGTNTATKNDDLYLHLHFKKGTLTFTGHDLWMDCEGRRQKIGTDTFLQGEKSYWGIGHKYLIRDYYKYLLGQGGNIIRVEDCIDALKLCDEIYHASVSGSL